MFAGLFLGMNSTNDGGTGGYWELLEPYWGTIDIYGDPDGFTQTYEAVPPVERDLYAAHFCMSEVTNGGLHQFFSNPTGVLAPEAAAALRRIGLSDTASVIERAMAYFDSPYPRDQGDRVERLDAESGDTREEWDPFFRLDTEFYSTLGENHDRFEAALDSYARSKP